MKNVLYIGNALYKTGSTATSIETLGKLLSEHYNIVIASNKSSKMLRLLDMCYSILSRRKWANYVLIDTYSTSNFYYAVIIGRICKVFKIKYIPILRGGNLESRLKNDPKKSSRLFLNAYTLVAPSHFLVDVFKKYNYSNVVFIPNNISVSNYNFTQRDYSSIRMLWVRSFSKIYNPELAIKVLKDLNKKGFSASLCMVGPEVDGSLLNCKKLAEELKLKVDFTGKLSKMEWIELSKKYNVFINTTNFDNTPISVMEAMALGLPIVSTNVGGMPYLIDHKTDGLLVKPESSESMTNAIIQLVENHDLVYKLTRNARRKVEQFDWNLVKNIWLDILR